MDKYEGLPAGEYTDHPLAADVLSAEAVGFLAELFQRFEPELQGLLAARGDRRSDPEWSPDFLSETVEVRNSNWRVSPPPRGLLDRRVEITGPPDRKMIINALNSGAKVYMADFEDSLSPTWPALLEGQINLSDAVKGDITYEHPKKGTYSLCDDPAVLFVRPRGLHLTEAHFSIHGRRIPASLFDFGLYIWRNSQCFTDGIQRPYFYLPKLEHWKEAQWWAKIFDWVEQRFSWDTGTIRATVLIETLPAVFQMEEILWALRNHSLGLNCGRWDYIFSYIKCFANNSERVTPDRSLIGMNSPFMETYSKLLIDTCHKRGCHAMGGMAAQIPIKGDIEAHHTAINKVRLDKLQEVRRGHDGTWVAHPGLVEIAQGMFDEDMPGSSQISLRNGWTNLPENQLRISLTQHPVGLITPQGFRQNVEVGVLYLAAWLEGSGCVPLHNLMEDAATAEISRTQLWQWIKYAAVDVEKETITSARLREELESVKAKYSSPRLDEAAELFMEFCTAEALPEFLTLAAYERIVTQ